MHTRFPQHKLAADDVVLWHAGSGFLRPEHAIVAAGTAVPETSFDDGLRKVVVIDAIRRSLDEKRPIELS